MKTFKQIREAMAGWSPIRMPIYTEIGHDPNEVSILWYYDRKNKRIHTEANLDDNIHYNLYDSGVYDEVAWGRIEMDTERISLATGEGRYTDHDIFSIAYDLKQKYPGFTIYGYGSGGQDRELGVFKG